MKIHPFLTAGAHGESDKSTRDLNSQTLTTFGATGSNNRATTAGFHANQKAVSTFTTGCRRLIRAFHDLEFLFRNGNKRVISQENVPFVNAKFLLCLWITLPKTVRIDPGS